MLEFGVFEAASVLVQNLNKGSKLDFCVLEFVLFDGNVYIIININA